MAAASVALNFLLTLIVARANGPSEGTVEAEPWPRWLKWAVIAVGTLVALRLSTSPPAVASSGKQPDEEEEDVDPPRDFTPTQLRKYNGTKPADSGATGFGADEPTPIFVALQGEVFDVSRAADHYGPAGEYHLFAGRDATRAFAKLSFDEADLDSPQTGDLNAGERDTLNDWYEKYKYYKQYPVVGRLSVPPSNLRLSMEELRKYDGNGEPPDGRLHAPIFIAVRRKIYDMSYGGVDFYKPGATYNIFAGRDASRALGKMSFQPEDIDSLELSDLTATQIKTLDDWDKKFAEKYPVVGELVLG